MRGTAEVGVQALDKMLDLIDEWQAKADAFVATGSDDDDVVATHDSRGALIELTVRPGLQQELTTAELEQRVCEAVAQNATRAYEGVMAISDEFLANFEEIPEELARHPVGARFADALAAASARAQQGRG